VIPILASSYFRWPVLQRLRDVCDRLGSFKQVVAGLQEYETMTSFFAHGAGTKPAEHTADEYPLVSSMPGRENQSRPMKQVSSFLEDTPCSRPDSRCC
jgi:hypothetical protein